MTAEKTVEMMALQTAGQKAAVMVELTGVRKVC